MTDPQDAQVVELRCPVGPRKLFAKLRLSGRSPEVTSDNLIELPCQYCRRELARAGREASLVLHRFNIIGELVETETIPRDPNSSGQKPPETPVSAERTRFRHGKGQR